jgi:hypothetical protein
MRFCKSLKEEPVISPAYRAVACLRVARKQAQAGSKSRDLWLWENAMSRNRNDLNRSLP